MLEKYLIMIFIPDSLKASKVSRASQINLGRESTMYFKGLLLFASTENKANKKGMLVEALDLVSSALA